MKKFSILCMSLMVAISVLAVPARRGWQTRTQADGTTVEIQQFGDEFYHYMINRDGKQVREVNGMYVEVGEAPTAEVIKARRAKGVARRQRQDVGTEPYLAPRGLLVLVNFKDTKYKSTNTQAVMDSLINAKDCQVNKDGNTKYPSAAQYFRDQSYGRYAPVFDVVGPVTLTKNVAYYGTNYNERGTEDEDGDYEFAADAIVEACKLVEDQVDFSLYDWNNDGEIDFVYVIYAGKGEADGGASSTIWPHNWSVNAARASSFCTYSTEQSKVDGLKINNYACSGELNGLDGTLNGIGTFCHEFGHVMGLPDLYDTSYGTNYKNCLTPNDWNIMDGGSYNGDGHCPPNYDPWEKDFFGWHTPINLGNEGQNITLYANGTENYQAYQINASGTYVGPTTSGLRYYIENRQAVGWDAPLTGHGLLIWKVNFNASAWENNAPNNTNTSGSPLYTVVSATGTKIGWDGSTDNCPKNTFPGSGKVTSWSGVSGKPLLNIAESNKVVTLIYIEEPVTPVDPFDVVWKSNGTDFATTQSTGTVVLPADEPEACTSGKVFVGWCSQADYSSETTAPTFVKAGDPVAEGAIFYAVFATQEGEGTPEVSDVLTRETTGVSGNNYTAWSDKTVTSTAVYAGNTAGGNDAIQLRTKNSNEGIITTAPGGKLAKVAVVWNENTTSGRKLDIYGKNSAYSSVADLYGNNNTTKGTKLGAIEYGETTELTVEGDYTFIGIRSNSNALYLDKLTITWGGGASYRDYSTSCGSGTGVDEVGQEAKTKSQKLIRDGQLFILRDGAEYNVLGVRVK